MSDQHDPTWPNPGSGPPQAYPGQPPYGSPAQPPYGSPGQPPYGSPAQPPVYPPPSGYPAQPPYGSPSPPEYSPAHPPAYPGMPGYGGESAGPPRWSGLAIAAFVVSFVPLIGLLAVLPLAIVALVKISRSGARGKWLAIAAIIIAVLWWVGAIAIGVWYNSTTVQRNSAGVIVSAGRIDFADIRIGDCVTIPDPAGSAPIQLLDVKGVPCGQPHNTEAVGLIPFDGSNYPGSAVLTARSQAPCVRLTTSYLGIDQLAGYQAYRLLPDESTWNNGEADHHVICFVAKSAFGDMRGSVRAH